MRGSRCHCCFRVGFFCARGICVYLKQVDRYHIEIEMFSTAQFVRVQNLHQNNNDTDESMNRRRRKREQRTKTQSSLLTMKIICKKQKKKTERRNTMKWNENLKKPAIIFRRFQFLLCAVNYYASYDVGE